MKLSILCIDDLTETLQEPLSRAFQPFMGENSFPELQEGGGSYEFSISAFGVGSVKVRIVINREVQPNRVIDEISDDLAGQCFDLVLLDDNWGQFGQTVGQERLLPCVLDKIRGVCPELPVIALFTEHWGQRDRVDMFCDEVARRPEDQQRLAGVHKDNTSDLLLLLQRAVVIKRLAAERDSRLAVLGEKDLPQDDHLGDIWGSTPAMQQVYACIRKVGPTGAAVLVRGESGTGKELVARAIHFQSDRSDGPLETVNCGAVAPELVDSELFGHVKGAFTGATKDRPGRFELADGGTIFLDEIGNLPPKCQVRLLRVINDGIVRRVGDTKDDDVDVRVIAATNEDLEEAMEDQCCPKRTRGGVLDGGSPGFQPRIPLFPKPGPPAGCIFLVQGECCPNPSDSWRTSPGSGVLLNGSSSQAHKSL